MVALIQSIGTPADGGFTAGQLAALGAYVDALDLKKQTLPKVSQQGSAEMQTAVKKLQPIFEAARKKAGDVRAPVDYRQAAVRVLGRGLDEEEKDRLILAGLLGPHTPGDLQIAAITALSKARGADVPKVTLSGWKAYGPAVRAHVLDTLLSRPQWVPPLMAALNSKLVLPAEVGAVHRQRLLQSKTEAIRLEAQKLFAEGTSADRKKLVDSYRAALAMKGDATKGAEIFQKVCAACHQLGGVGQQVGPDLAAEAAKPGETLLVAILDPNAAVEARYVSYNATTKSGVVISGLLASETGGSVTLIANDGKKHDIARADLDELVSTGKSMMPEGLEKDIAVAQMADLLAHLRKFAAPPTRKVFGGNAPALVQANADGSLTLTPANCEIYGRTLSLEKAGNLGHWQSEDDRAVWTMQVPKATQYAIWLEWACAKANAGNTLALEVEGKKVLSIPVKATANAETYQFTKFGVVTLPAGRQTLTLRAGGQIQGNVIDLKELKLTPPPKKYSD
jgi:putative heme-binding domain-containing protein